jgi:hypothetical protein
LPELGFNLVVLRERRGAATRSTDECQQDIKTFVHRRHGSTVAAIGLCAGEISAAIKTGAAHAGIYWPKALKAT